MFYPLEYYNGKTILVTGAAGFIGSSVVQALNAFDCHLVCLVSGRRESEATGSRGKARLTIIEQDIRSPLVWDELLEEVDIVFHFAAQTSSRFANENPLEDLEINLTPVVRLIGTCQKKGFRPDIIFSGTVTQTGVTTDYPISENRCDMPITVYDINKLAEEKYLQYYGLQMGGRSVTLRLANVYGPGTQSSRADRGIVNIMIRKALAGEPLTIYDGGNYIRDYLFIDDAVKAFMTAGTCMPTVNGKYYVLGSGKGHSIKHMAQTVRDLVASATGRHVPINDVPAPTALSPIEFRHFVADIGAFQKDCGWKPRASLQEGILHTIQHLVER